MHCKKLHDNNFVQINHWGEKKSVSYKSDQHWATRARGTVTGLPNFLGWVDYHISFAPRVELRYGVQTKIKVDLMQQTTERNSIKSEQYCRKQVWDYVEISIVWLSHPLSG